MIKIPDSIFKPYSVDGKIGHVWVYALDRNTIGITDKFEIDWATNSIAHRRVVVTRLGTNWVVSLPSVLTTHYLLNQLNTKVVVTASGGRIIITVTRSGK